MTEQQTSSIPDTASSSGAAVAGPAEADTDQASVKDKAADSAQAGKQAAADVAHTAVDQAKGVAGEAGAQARNLVGEAGDQLRGHAGDQHRNAVTNLRSLADELASMAGNGQQDGPATGLVSQVADRTHSAADWLEARQPEDLLDELRTFARRRPGSFLLGALAAGVVAGRLGRGVAATHSDDESSGAASSADRPLSGSGQLGGPSPQATGGDRHGGPAPGGFDTPRVGGPA